MKTLFLECNMGAAGDMLMSALLELSDKPDEFIEKMNHLGLDNLTVVRESASKCGIQGTRVRVILNGVEESSQDVNFEGVHIHEGNHSHLSVGEHVHTHEGNHSHFAEEQAHIHEGNHSHLNEGEHVHTHEGNHSHLNGGEHAHTHEGNHSHLNEGEHVHTHEENHIMEHNNAHHHDAHHHHSGMSDIIDIINRLSVSQKVKDDAISIYQLIAEAESKAHGKPVTQVHFHEVGAMDAIADIVGTCILIEELAPDQIMASPVHLGSGFVRCAHGVLPVPAPATAHILRGVPTYSGDIKGELCTPTGAAVLKHFVHRFGNMPIMITEKIGYGMGHKDFKAANCIRAFIGDTEVSVKETERLSVNNEIAELCCNLDDMTGEDIGFAVDILLESGAFDVFLIPIQMKKNRPGTLLTCICSTKEADRFAGLIMKYTTTIGIRKNICERYIMEREFHTVATKYGDIGYKLCNGYGTMKFKPEYEDLVKASKTFEVSIEEVRNRAVEAIKDKGCY